MSAVKLIAKFLLLVNPKPLISVRFLSSDVNSNNIRLGTTY